MGRGQITSIEYTLGGHQILCTYLLFIFGECLYPLLFIIRRWVAIVLLCQDDNRFPESYAKLDKNNTSKTNCHSDVMYD